MKDNIINQNTSAWRIQVWAIFIISFGGMLFGLVNLETDVWVKAFLAMCFISTVSACFTLAKTIRDDHESEKLINRISSAKTEKILNEFEP